MCGAVLRRDILRLRTGLGGCGAGCDRGGADDAHAGGFARAGAADCETLATKTDLAELEARLTRRLVMLGAAIGGMLAAAVAMLKFL